MKNLYEKDDELRKRFEDAFSDVGAPEDLKNRTLAQMQEQAGQKGKTSSAPGRKLWYFCSAAVLLCILAVTVFGQRNRGASYLTAMEEGVYYDSVELKDGEILFVANRVAISITPSVGSITVGQEESNDAAVWQVIEEKQTKTGGTLSYQKTGSADLPETGEQNRSHIGSQDIYVTVLKTEEIRYQAVFERNGEAFEVIGKNVTQKEFIDYLYSKVKK